MRSASAAPPATARPPLSDRAHPDRPRRRPGEEWLRRLRILAIALPVAAVTVALALRSAFVGLVSPDIGHLVLDAVLVGATLVFGVVMFSVIDRGYRALLQENRDLAAVDAVVDAGRLALDAPDVAEACLATVLEVTGASRGEIEASHPADPTRAPDRWTREASREGDQPDHGGAGAVEGDVSVPLRSGPRSFGTLTLGGLRPESNHLSEDAYLGLGRAVGSAVQRARYVAHLQQESHDATLAERDRIAREMHDSLAQALGAAHLRLLTLVEDPDLAHSPRVRRALEDLAAGCHDAYADVREAILGLRESGRRDRSLLESLRDYVEKFGRQSGVDTTLVTTVEDLTLTPHHEVQVIRIVQEALTNVRKHASASTAVVRIEARAGAICVSVEDDGAGFEAADVQADRFGLTSMSERTSLVDGSLAVDSAPGRGTRVSLIVPRDALAPAPRTPPDPSGDHARRPRVVSS